MPITNPKHIRSVTGSTSANLSEQMTKFTVDISQPDVNVVLAAAADFFAVTNALAPFNMAVGLTSKQVTNGEIFVAEMAGATGAGDAAAIAYEVLGGVNGKVLNITTLLLPNGDPHLNADGREVMCLWQAANGTADGAAVGAANCQISFVSMQDDNSLALDVVVAGTYKTSRRTWIPEFNRPRVADATGPAHVVDIIQAQSLTTLETIFTVTTAFALNEVIDVTAGTGAAAGVATVAGDAITTLGVDSPAFVADKTMSVNVNGLGEVIRGTDVVWASATTLSFPTIVLEVGDIFSITRLVEA